MSRPFEALCETLLRAGVAPRHVRRYERELSEHLDDLLAMQSKRGYDGEDAYLRARALLGSDDELAEAMMARRQLRSLMARAPWLVFGLTPPLLVFALLAGVGLMMLGVWALLPGYHPAPPIWLGTIAHAWGGIANVAAGPLAAVWFVVIAVRQRQPWHWPLFAVAFTAFTSAFTVFVVRLPDHGRLGEIGVGLGAESATLWENIARFAMTLAVVAAASVLARRQIRAPA
jgi:hypothetical protein